MVMVVVGARLCWIRRETGQSFWHAVVCSKHPLGVSFTNLIAQFYTGKLLTVHATGAGGSSGAHLPDR